MLGILGAVHLLHLDFMELVSAAFFLPLFTLLSRALYANHILDIASMAVSADGVQTIGYRFQFPFFYFVAILGLSL